MNACDARRRILVVCEDDQVGVSISVALASEGYEVRAERDMADTLAAVGSFQPDLALLQVRADDSGGLAVARQLRDLHDLAIVCAIADAHDGAVEAFEAGADDVVSSVTSIDELLARIKAVLRRTGREAPTRWIVADLVLDEPAHSVHRGSRPIALTRLEFEILLALVRQQRHVVSKSVLLATVWGSDVYDENVVEAHMSSLRRKLESGGEPRLIQTVRNVGYVARENPL